MKNEIKSVTAHDARAVANYFIDKGREDNVEITHLKLQKLIYFAHGWTLSITNKNLIRDAVEAWQHGPVIRTVYDSFKKFGGESINAPALEFDLDARQKVKISSNFSQVQKEIMDRVWEVYGSIEATKLSNLTHRDGTPWAEIRAKDDTVIPNTLIKSYFDNLKKNNGR